MSMIFADSAASSSVDIIQTIGSATNATVVGWSSTVQATFTTPGMTLALPVITQPHIGKSITIYNSGTYSFTLAMSTGTIAPSDLLTVSQGQSAIVKAISATTAIITGSNSKAATPNTTPSVNSLVVGASSIEMYGDSMTFGAGLTAPFFHATKLGEEYNKTITNRAVSGEGLWFNVKNHLQNINPTHKVCAVWMAGFNDVKKLPVTSQTRARVRNSYTAVLANHFLKIFLPGFSSDSRIVRSASPAWTVSDGTPIGFKSATGATASGIGASFQYSFFGDNVVIGTGTCLSSFQTWASYDIRIDGILKGNFTGQDEVDGLIIALHDGNRMAKSFVFTDLGDTSHNLTITSTTAGLLYIDYVGVMRDPAHCQPIVMCEIPKLSPQGYALPTHFGNSSDATFNIFNQEIRDVCNIFSSRGYPIKLIDTNRYYDWTLGGVQGDFIHPNNLGAHQIYNAINRGIKGLD